MYILSFVFFTRKVLVSSIFTHAWVPTRGSASNSWFKKKVNAGRLPESCPWVPRRFPHLSRSARGRPWGPFSGEPPEKKHKTAIELEH